MPVTWMIQDSILVLWLSGDYEFHELREAVGAALADPGFRRGMPLLVDARSSSIHLSIDETLRRSDWFGSLLDRGLGARYAFLLHDHRFGMSAASLNRMQELGVDARLFPDPASAR